MSKRTNGTTLAAVGGISLAAAVGIIAMRRSNVDDLSLEETICRTCGEQICDLSESVEATKSLLCCPSRRLGKCDILLPDDWEAAISLIGSRYPEAGAYVFNISEQTKQAVAESFNTGLDVTMTQPYYDARDSAFVVYSYALSKEDGYEGTFDEFSSEVK